MSSHSRGRRRSSPSSDRSVRGYLRAGLPEGCKKAFRRFKIRRVEPFGKTVVNRLQDCQRFGGTVQITQQPREARCRAEFPGQRTLLTGPVERLPEVILGRRRGSGLALQQQKLALDA